MRRTGVRFVYWAPRVLGIAFALFISRFALDSFSQNLPLAEEILAFAFHLLPTAVLVLMLVFAWKHEWMGGAGFIALGLFFVWLMRMTFPLPVYLVICGPVILVGLLFLADSFLRRKRRERSA